MSAIAAIVGRGDRAPDEAIVGQMLSRMASRGSDVVEVRAGDALTVLGVARQGWEMTRGIAGAVGIAVDGDVSVACDASIYYRDDLRRALAAAGVTAAGDSPAELIAAAYRAWGDALATRLEGDFAFVLHDARARRVVAARDFAGSRPLHFGMAGGRLVIASTVGGVLGDPAIPTDLDVSALAAVAAGFFSDAAATSYRGVSLLGAGRVLTFEAGSPAPVVRTFWKSPPFEDEIEPRVPFAEAAEELRRLLYAATAERLAIGAPTALSLSGGWDSPAVYGIGQRVLRDRGEPATMLRGVSISFPEGDTGREDDLIRSITGFWDTETSWLDIRDMSMFGDAAASAAARDEPFAHPYAAFNIGLARGARAAGAHVILGGLGGDQLFHAEPAYIGDLVRHGRWGTAAREWRAQGALDTTTLREFVVRPLLPAGARRLVQRVRGGELPRGYLQRTLPSWIRPEIVRELRLVEREHAAFSRAAGESAAAYEKRWLLANPFYPRITRAAWDDMLAVGVEERSPLFDERVVRFAATRPRRERRTGRESKLLLRAAVRGLLPDAVLAPREHKTGTMTDYFGHAMQTEFPPLAAPLFGSPLLAELGIVDARALQAAGARVERGLAESHGSALVFTLQVELWLRGRSAAPEQAGAARPG